MNELTLLNYFRVTARLENMTRAAEALYMSQPNLSRAIKRLESSLGVQLFDRTRGHLSLNEYGAAYLEYVEGAFTALEGGEECLREMISQKVSGHISVGCVMQMYAVEMIDAFFLNNGNGNVTISYSQMDTDSIGRSLRNGSLDFAITPKADFLPGIEWTPVFSCPICVLISRDNPISVEGVIELSELSEQDFICNNVGVDRRETLKLCRDAGFEPSILMDSNESVYVGKWIEKGKGVSLISAYDLIGLSKTYSPLPVRVARFPDSFPHLVLGIAQRRDNNHDGQEAKRALYNFALSHFRTLERSIAEEWEAFWKSNEDHIGE